MKQWIIATLCLTIVSVAGCSGSIVQLKPDETKALTDCGKVAGSHALVCMFGACDEEAAKEKVLCVLECTGLGLKEAAPECAEAFGSLGSEEYGQALKNFVEASIILYDISIDLFHGPKPDEE